MDEIFGSLSKEIITIVITAIVAGIKSIKFVHEGELGIRLRFGKAQRNRKKEPKIINPGFVLMIPFIDSLRRHHVRQQTIRLDNQKVMMQEGLIFNVSAMVVFKVKNIYSALFEIDDLDSSLEDFSMATLRDILAKKSYHELSDMELIAKELLEKIQEKADEWGVQFLTFKLTDCAPTQETAPLINAEAGVNLKIKALQKAAESMNMDFHELSPTLAAALIGIPVATALNPEIHLNANFRNRNKKEEKQSLLEKITE